MVGYQPLHTGIRPKQPAAVGLGRGGGYLKRKLIGRDKKNSTAHEMKREAGGQGEFLLCPQGKAASPRFMGVIVLRMQIQVYETPGCPVG
jgi:hypothetical protein